MAWIPRIFYIKFLHCELPVCACLLSAGVVFNTTATAALDACTQREIVCNVVTAADTG